MSALWIKAILLESYVLGSKFFMWIFSFIKSSTVNVCKPWNRYAGLWQLHQRRSCINLLNAGHSGPLCPTKSPFPAKQRRAWDSGCSLNTQPWLSTITPSLFLVYSHMADNHKSKREWQQERERKREGGREGERLRERKRERGKENNKKWPLLLSSF